jgi:hypothetical protein
MILILILAYSAGPISIIKLGFHFHLDSVRTDNKKSYSPDGFGVGKFMFFPIRPIGQKRMDILIKVVNIWFYLSIICGVIHYNITR